MPGVPPFSLWLWFLLGPCTAYPHHFTIQQKRYVKPFKQKNTVVLQVQQHLHSIGALVHDIDFGDDTNGSAANDETRNEATAYQNFGPNEPWYKIPIYIPIMHQTSFKKKKLQNKEDPFPAIFGIFTSLVELPYLVMDIHHGFMTKPWPVFCT